MPRIVRDTTRRFHPRIYQRTAGIIGHRVRHGRVLLLHTRGRRSGRTHTVALRYVRDGAQLVVVGSNRGASTDPDWVLNLRSQSGAHIQVGRHHLRVTATITTPHHDPQRWERVTAKNPRWASYQDRTTRALPVAVLEPVKEGVTTPLTHPPSGTVPTIP